MRIIQDQRHAGTGRDSTPQVFCLSEHPGCNNNQGYLSFARPADTTQYTSDVGAQAGPEQ